MTPLHLLASFILSLLFISSVIAVGLDNQNLPIVRPEVISFDNNTGSVNSSEFSSCWITSEGVKCDVSDITYDEISGGDVNALGYTGTFNYLAGVVGSLDMRGDPWWLGGTDLQIDKDLIVDGDGRFSNIGVSVAPDSGILVRGIANDVLGTSMTVTQVTDYLNSIAGYFEAKSSPSTDPVVINLKGVQGTADHGSNNIFGTAEIIGGDFLARVSLTGDDTQTIPIVAGVKSDLYLHGDDTLITNGDGLFVDYSKSTNQDVTNAYGVKVDDITGASNNYAWKSGLGISEFKDDINVLADNKQICFGGGTDACIDYDGTNMYINPKSVGTGKLYVSGDVDTQALSSTTGDFSDDVVITATSGDASSFELDGATNDYTGFALRGLKVTRDMDSTVDLFDYDVAFENRLASFEFLDKRAGYSIANLRQPRPTYTGAFFELGTNDDKPITGGSPNDATYNSVVFKIDSHPTFSAENTGTGQFVLSERGLELEMSGGGSDRSSGGGFDYYGKGANIVMSPNLNSDLHYSEALGLNFDIYTTNDALDNAVGLKFTRVEGTDAYDILSTSGADWLINDTESDFTTRGDVTIEGNFSAKRAYIMVSSNESQIVTVADTVYTMNFSHIEDEYLMDLEGGENITFQDDGDYLVSISTIVVTDTNNKYFNVFPQIYNGTAWNNVPRSNTRLEIENAGTEEIIAVTFMLDIEVGEKVRLMYSSDDAGSMTVWTAESGTGVNTIPETPSTIMTIMKHSEITD